MANNNDNNNNDDDDDDNNNNSKSHNMRGKSHILCFTPIPPAKKDAKSHFMKV